MNPQVILLGAPGCGKGTQAALMVSKLRYKHVSTGDLLRAEVAKKSDLGLKISSIMEAGKLVDDDTVLELLSKNCDLTSGSYIFDGFPRNIEQAKSLDKIVLKEATTAAIYLEVDFKELLSRITNRRSCSKCGEIFNLISKPPARAGACDKCGGELAHRKDDNESTVQNRLDVFQKLTAPVLDYYKKKGILKTIDAGINPDITFKQISDLLG